MQEKFEYNIQKQLNDFKIEPSDQTWTEVENALHPRHEKRGIFWWWMPLTGVIIAGLIFWISYSNKTPQFKKSSAYHYTIQKDSILTSVQKKKNEANASTIQSSSTETLKKTTEKCIERNGYCTITHNDVIVRNHINKTKINSQEDFYENNNLKDEKEANRLNTIADDINSVQKKDFVNKEDENAIKKSDSIFKKNDDQNQSAKKNDSSVKQTLIIQKNKNIKKGRWLIAFDGGLLNISNKSFFGSNNSSQSLSSSPSNNSGGSTSQLYITNPNKGFEFGIGFHHQNKISQKWSFETGLMYRYLQNKQSVGNKKDSILGNYTYSIANYYYSVGNSDRITNYIHRIEIPFLFNYIINPNKKNNFYLQAGIEAGYIFSKKWLIADESYNSYYYRSSLLNNFQLSTLFGFGINFNSHIQANINYSRSVTPLYKLNNNKIYTNQISLQVLIPVGSINKK